MSDLLELFRYLVTMAIGIAMFYFLVKKRYYGGSKIAYRMEAILLGIAGIGFFFAGLFPSVHYFCLVFGIKR